ncbi:MAG: energy transducer TonB [Synechococcaceae cyanobacterium SM1_2_3]|nr:energy transducer TonB [Synechococcaceae cyanobacterium SM1_2_3]
MARSSPPRSSPPAARVNTLRRRRNPVYCNHPLKPPPLLLNPRYRRPPSPPVYPLSAIRLNQQGTVLVQAKISTAGDVIELGVHQSSGHPLLDAAALAAVRRWAFVPATRNNQPVEAWVRVPVHFVLNTR